jgi:quinol monooxygenase YgiN
MEQDGTAGTSPASVRLSGKLICASQEEAALVAAHLPEHIRLTRLEPGCVSFEVTQTDDSMIWRVEELFSDKAAFEAHQNRAKSSIWGLATKTIRREFQISTDFSAST